MGETRKIVVVEDDPLIRDAIAQALRREGFAVIGVGEGEQALPLIAQEAPVLVLLDVILPGLDGLEVCRRLKQDPSTSAIPIVMITARSEESDVVIGLGLGADDYIIKPFRPRELVARVRAVLRRGALRTETVSGRVTHGDVAIDADRHEVRAGGQEVHLTATEFRLLHFLASHPGRVFTRDQLAQHAIGRDTVVVDRNIDVHVRAIREKLGPSRRRLIETVRGVGYRFLDLDEARA